MKKKTKQENLFQEKGTCLDYGSEILDRQENWQVEHNSILTSTTEW